MAPADSDASYRTRLEGRAELLDQARGRYRELLPKVTAFRWRQQLAGAAALVRAVREAQDAVDEAVAMAERRARAEGWRPDSEVVKSLREVKTLRRALLAAVHRRLKAHAGLTLGEALRRLEQRLVTEPRLVLPGRRWEVAEEVLPPALPELGPALALGRVAEALFATPPVEAAALPTPAELARLEAAWAPGTAALAALWQRLMALDLAGTLVRFLRSHARARPDRAPKSGPEQLLFAEHWRGVAVARLDQALDALLSPVRPREAERFPLLRWLARRPLGTEARLEAEASLGEGRVGLFELALALQHGKARAPGEWEPLLVRARRADLARDEPDWTALHQRLSALATVLRAPTPERLPPLYRARTRMAPTPPPPRPSPLAADSLEGLVEELRRLSSPHQT